MISCRRCRKSIQTSIHEELEDCALCQPEKWRIYNIVPNRKQPHAVERAMQSAPYSVFGNCMLTPRGHLVPVHMLREYRLSRILPKVAGQKTQSAGGES